MARKVACHLIFEHSVFDGRVFHKEAASLARAGYDVVLLVPEVRRGWLGRKREQAVPAGNAFVREGVRFETYRCPRWMPRVFGLRDAAIRRAILRALGRLRPALCHVHEDGVVLAAAAELKAVLPGTRLVYDVHEFFLHRLRRGAAGRRRLRRFVEHEDRVLAAADAVLTVSDFISDYYRTLYRGPVHTVMNCQSARVFARPAATGPAGGFRVVHEGRMLFDRGLRLLVEAAAAVRHPDVRFLLIGNLPRGEAAWFEAETARLGIRDRFEVTGMLPYHEVPAALARGAVGIHFIEGTNGLTGGSNKFFNYLCFGLPVLTLEHPVVGPLVRRADCGTVFPSPPDPAAIAARIDALARDAAECRRQGENAARLFRDELNWEVMEARLLEAYREALGPP